jgi:TetR/AcrR family transcriptional regulator, cholesterol catabolism regulator
MRTVNTRSFEGESGKPARGIVGPKSVGRVSARGADRLERVLEAATDMFHENGYANTSVQDVANAVGLLKGSLYYYIDSKEDLLFRIVDDVHRDVQSTLDEATSAEDLAPLERLAQFARKQVEYNARNVKKIAVYHHEWTRLEGDRLADVRRRRRQQEQAVIALLDEAKERGELDPQLDVKLASACVFATIIWPYTWYRPGSTSPDKLSQYCADFILHGVVGAHRSGRS